MDEERIAHTLTCRLSDRQVHALLHAALEFDREPRQVLRVLEECKTTPCKGCVRSAVRSENMEILSDVMQRVPACIYSWNWSPYYVKVAESVQPGRSESLIENMLVGSFCGVGTLAGGSWGQLKTRTRRLIACAWRAVVLEDNRKKLGFIDQITKPVDTIMQWECTGTFDEHLDYTMGLFSALGRAEILGFLLDLSEWLDEDRLFAAARSICAEDEYRWVLLFLEFLGAKPAASPTTKGPDFLEFEFLLSSLFLYTIPSERPNVLGRHNASTHRSHAAHDMWRFFPPGDRSLGRISEACAARGLQVPWHDLASWALHHGNLSAARRCRSEGKFGWNAGDADAAVRNNLPFDFVKEILDELHGPIEECLLLPSVVEASRPKVLDLLCLARDAKYCPTRHQFGGEDFGEVLNDRRISEYAEIGDGGTRPFPAYERLLRRRLARIPSAGYGRMVAPERFLRRRLERLSAAEPILRRCKMALKELGADFREILKLRQICWR